jgi:hypothetical protein
MVCETSEACERSDEKRLEKQAQERGARGSHEFSFYLNQVLNHNGGFAVDRVAS